MRQRSTNTPAEQAHWDRLLAEYRPHMKPEQWSLICMWVCITLRRLPATNQRTMESMRSTLTTFAHWAHLIRCMPLDDRILDAAHIEAFAARRQPRAARAVRAVLRNIARNSIPNWNGGARPSLPTPPPSAPYTARQVAALWELARRQPTEHRRYEAHLIVTLGLDAGIDSRNLASITPADITDHHSYHTIELAGPERTIPINPRWNDLLRAATHQRPVGQPLLSADVVRNRVVGINRVHSGTPLSVQRLRSTYIVGLLNTATPLRVVGAVTGLTPFSLAGYATHTDQVTSRDLIKHLTRGDS